MHTHKHIHTYAHAQTHKETHTHSHHRNQHSYNGLSLALYGLASQAEAFERVCMLPPPTPAQMVQAALHMLGSGYDAVRGCEKLRAFRPLSAAVANLSFAPFI